MTTLTKAIKVTVDGPREPRNKSREWIVGRWMNAECRWSGGAGSEWSSGGYVEWGVSGVVECKWSDVGVRRGRGGV